MKGESMSRARELSIVLAFSIIVSQGSGCALLVGGAAAGTAASVEESQRHDHSATTYVGTVLANVFYFPAKVLFAAGGAVASGITYLATVGNRSTTAEVWNSTVGGDYVVTPDMVAGYESVRFVDGR
jgi:hypothetical protein